MPINKQISSPYLVRGPGQSPSKTVIGVVKDFHNGSLHEEIKPSLYMYRPDNSTILIRIRPENIPETLAFLEKKWQELPTHLIFLYRFTDSALRSQGYQKDKEIGRIFIIAGVLAIVLACLGLFGLASYTAERRIKEIGIRKVLGASVPNIIILICRDFSLLILLANIIAWPIGYYIMHRWLQDFAYRAGIAWWIFVLAAVMTFIITLLTIINQSKQP
jgi:putative ABC transport system permease protein